MKAANAVQQMAANQMNPELNFIFSRRSVRSYTKNDIPSQLLTDLLTAGMAAPSAMAKDPWHFILVQEPSRLRETAKILPHGRMIRHAKAGIIVCGDLDQAHDKQESYMLQDCSAAIENILLAATALGLGSCWLGIHPRKERMKNCSRLFSLPEHIIPIGGISLGWPAKTPEARTRLKQENIHTEQWTKTEAC